MPAKIKALALKAVTAIGVAVRNAASFALSVPGSTKGTLIAGEFKKALAIATAAATFAGGLDGFVSYLANDQAFIAALVPFVTAAGARIGIVLPGGMATAVVTFVLSQLVALVAYYHTGKKPATPATVVSATPAECVNFTFPLIEIDAAGQDLGALAAQVVAKHGGRARVVDHGDGTSFIYMEPAEDAEPKALVKAIEAEFPGTEAIVYA